MLVVTTGNGHLGRGLAWRSWRAENQDMPEPAAQPTEAGHRRQAVATLRLAEAVARYAAARVADGIGPEEARCAVWDAAGELDELAGLLRRLAGARAPGRRAAAGELASAGLPRQEIADRLRVSRSAVRGYLRPGSRS